MIARRPRPGLRPRVTSSVLGFLHPLLHPSGQVVKIGAACLLGKTLLRLLRGPRQRAAPRPAIPAPEPAAPAPEEPRVPAREQWAPTCLPATQPPGNFKQVVQVTLPCSVYTFYERFLSNDSTALQVRHSCLLVTVAGNACLQTLVIELVQLY